MMDPAQRATAELRQLGSGGRADRLHLRLVLQLLLRCLPLLRGVRRHLALLALLALALFAAILPLALIGLDVFWTGVLQGQPLPEIQARVLGLDPELVSRGDSLAAAARRLVRDRLLIRSALVTFLVALPATGALVYYYVWITQRLNQDLRLRLHDRLQTLSLRFHAQHRVGDALYRVHQDSSMVSDLIEALFLTPFQHLGRHLVATAAVALFDPRLAAIFLLLWPPALAVGWAVSRRLRVGFRAARESNAALTARIQEILAGIRVVKAYGAEPAAQRSFEEHSRAAFDAAFGARDLVCVLSIAVFVVVCAAVLAALGVGFELTREGDLLATAGLLAAFGLTRWTLGSLNFLKGELGAGSTSVRVLFRMWARLQDMAIGLDRVFELLDLEPEVRDAPDAVDVPPLRRGVAFRDVTFGYRPGQPVLHGVSFEARPGSVTALVGPTGSGKSTLVGLLLRLFDPDGGAIEIDGVDLRRIRLASLREKVAIALQENLLFGATVRDNVRYAAPGASEEALRHAARVACAEEFIERLPAGWETQLGERGAKLSTGQRQRLSIARALAKDPPIVVLDEPTAALDAETELRLLDNLAAWGRDRAILLVTHRLSTIRRADQILVLEDGRLAQRGTHAELAAREGPYRRLLASEDPEAP
jgi:ABC-type multidrug transport system fused ATPase/permease subunit